MATIPTKDEEKANAVLDASPGPLIENGDSAVRKQYRREIAGLLGLLFVAMVVWITVLSINLSPGSDSSSSDDGHQTAIEQDIQSETTKPANCLIPPYVELDGPAECHDLVNNTEHTNSYWTNEQFHCRLNARPCDVIDNMSDDDYEPFHFTLDLGGEHGILDLGMSGRWGEAAEVWIGINGTDETCAKLEAEGSNSEEIFTMSLDVNDYVFDSLECCDTQYDSELRFFVIIDGVLVDSCPKHYAENCRTCVPTSL